MSYIVTSPAVSVWADGRTTLVGPFYEGAELPAGLDKDHLRMLLDEELIGKAPKSADPAPAGDSKPTTVGDIVKEVGTDKGKAQQYLDEENAKGEEARSTLVEKLQAVLSKED